MSSSSSSSIHPRPDDDEIHVNIDQPAAKRYKRADNAMNGAAFTYIIRFLSLCLLFITAPASGVDNNDACGWLPSLRLSKLKRITDARQVCTDEWRTAPGSTSRASFPPIWEVRAADLARSDEIEAVPSWPVKCASGRSQCSSTDEPLRFCIIAVHDAVVLESGLVVNRTHRFDLGSSFERLATSWKSDGFGVNGRSSKPGQTCEDRETLLRELGEDPPASDRGVPLRSLYSTRMLYGENPFHTLFQTLPLASLAFGDTRRDRGAVVLAQSAMAGELAKGAAPRVLVREKRPVAASTVHIVAGEPPFSPLNNIAGFGSLAPLRRRPPQSDEFVAATTVVFLRRSQGAAASSLQNSTTTVRARAARALTNEVEVIERTRQLVAALAPALRFEVYQFNSLAGQRAVFSRAAIVIGPQGTAFSGLAFSGHGLRAVIEWAYLRVDSWVALGLLGSGAKYFQLMPHWHDGTKHRRSNSNKPAMLRMDESRWELTSVDMGVYEALLSAVLTDGGEQLVGAARGREVARGIDSERKWEPEVRSVERDCKVVEAHRLRSSGKAPRCGASETSKYRQNILGFAPKTPRPTTASRRREAQTKAMVVAGSEPEPEPRRARARAMSQPAGSAGGCSAQVGALNASTLAALLEEQSRRLRSCAGARFFLKSSSPLCTDVASDSDGHSGDGHSDSVAAPPGSATTGATTTEACVRDAFVTGVEGGGTHYAANYLKLMKIGSVKHELDGKASDAEADVLVSWMSRAPAALRARATPGDFSLSVPRSLDPSNAAGSWARAQLAPPCTYRVLVHLTRHPLSVLQSLLTFRKCYTCWALIEYLAIPTTDADAVGSGPGAAARASPLVLHTCHVAHLIAGLRRETDAVGNVVDNRETAEARAARRTLTEGNMLFYVLWNRAIEIHADRRVAVESADFAAVCAAIIGPRVRHELSSATAAHAAATSDADWRTPGWCTQQDRKVAAAGKGVKRVSHGGGKVTAMTWQELGEVNSGLAEELWRIAQESGYGRDPPEKTR